MSQKRGLEGEGGSGGRGIGGKPRAYGIQETKRRECFRKKEVFICIKMLLRASGKNKNKTS